MYEEKKSTFNWKSFLLKFIIITLVLVIVIKLLPFDQKKTTGFSKVFTNNMSKLKEVGNNYFNEDNIPNDDEELIITLEQLEKEEKIDTLKDSNGNKCDSKNSYLKVFKISVGYELEVNLECGDEKDSSFIYLGCFNKCNTTTTTTTTTKKTTKKTTTKTTKKTTTTTKNNNVNVDKTTTTTTTTTTKKQGYAVIFNVKGGSEVNNQYVLKGNKAVKPINPTKEGYSFAGWYLNDSLYDFNTVLNSNIILVAKWIPNN